MSPGDGAPTVPDAELRSYYGRPIIKPPAWRSPDVPLYLYLGGTAGTSAVLAALADATGRPGLRRAVRIAAGAAAAGSIVALIHDLGRPARFLNMLRVFKVTSPLSVGSWILAPFGTLAAAAAASEISGRAPRAGRAAGVGSAVLGPILSTYTAVLIADTAVPAWHDTYRDLPWLFAGSAVVSGSAVGLAFAPVAEARPVRRLAVAGAAVELAAARRVEAVPAPVGTAYRTGRAGGLLRAARALTAAGLVTTVVGGRCRCGARAAAALLTAGSLCTRFGVYEAGVASARDPEATVGPQKERLAARAAS